MKRTLSLLFLPVLLAFTLGGITNWTVKPAGVKIDFSLPAEPHKLSFSGLDASIAFDPADLAASEVIARIDVKTLATEDPGLTQHLLSPDFLDAKKYPRIKLMSTGFEKQEGGGYLMHAALAIKDSVHAVLVPFTFETKGEEGLFKGSFEIFSGDYGVMKKSKSGGDKVVINLEIPVTRSK
ncbi:MAG TPA: YceI family protein [Bacteroidia bacterium]|jgi:polyisoprenoid-binding protein YceI